MRINIVIHTIFYFQSIYRRLFLDTFQVEPEQASAKVVPELSFLFAIKWIETFDDFIFDKSLKDKILNEIFCSFSVSGELSATHQETDQGIEVNRCKFATRLQVNRRIRRLKVDNKAIDCSGQFLAQD